MSFTYYVIKYEDIYGKLKNDGSMIDYVYSPEPFKIWWRNLWTAPKKHILQWTNFFYNLGLNSSGQLSTSYCLFQRFIKVHFLRSYLTMTFIFCLPTKAAIRLNCSYQQIATSPPSNSQTILKFKTENHCISHYLMSLSCLEFTPNWKIGAWKKNKSVVIFHHTLKEANQSFLTFHSIF